MKATEAVHDNRLWHTRKLVQLVGGTNEAARRLGKKNAYITSIAGPNPTRTIGDKVAAQIEKSFNLAPGSLDRLPPSEAHGGDLLIREVAATLVHATERDKRAVLFLAQHLMQESFKYDELI